MSLIRNLNILNLSSNLSGEMKRNNVLQTLKYNFNVEFNIKKGIQVSELMENYSQILLQFHQIPLYSNSFV